MFKRKGFSRRATRRAAKKRARLVGPILGRYRKTKQNGQKP